MGSWRRLLGRHPGTHADSGWLRLGKGRPAVESGEAGAVDAGDPAAPAAPRNRPWPVQPNASRIAEARAWLAAFPPYDLQGARTLERNLAREGWDAAMTLDGALRAFEEWAAAFGEMSWPPGD